MDSGNDGSAGYFSWAMSAQSGGNINLSLDCIKWRISIERQSICDSLQSNDKRV